MERSQFTFYESFRKAIGRIKKKQDRADAYDAICDYALYGIEPDLGNMADAAAIAFELIRPNLDASRRKASGGSSGKPAKDPAKITERCGKDTANKKEKEKEKEKEGEIEKEKEYECTPQTPRRFTPPSVSDVREYCLERGNSVDPECFLDHYTSNGWKVGKNPMKDWKAAVRTWEKSEKQQGRKDNGFATSNPFLEMLQEERGL